MMINEIEFEPQDIAPTFAGSRFIKITWRPDGETEADAPKMTAVIETGKVGDPDKTAQWHTVNVANGWARQGYEKILLEYLLSKWNIPIIRTAGGVIDFVDDAHRV